MAYFNEIKSAKRLRNYGIRLSSTGGLVFVVIAMHIYASLKNIRDQNIQPDHRLTYTGLAVSAGVVIIGQIMRETGKRRRDIYIQRAQQEALRFLPDSFGP